MSEERLQFKRTQSAKSDKENDLEKGITKVNSEKKRHHSLPDTNAEKRSSIIEDPQLVHDSDTGEYSAHSARAVRVKGKGGVFASGRRGSGGSSSGSSGSGSGLIGTSSDRDPTLVSGVQVVKPGDIVPDSSIKVTFDLKDHGVFTLQFPAQGWMGNIVQRVRTALGNPSDFVVRKEVVPPATRILSNTRSRLVYVKDSNRSRVLPLPDAIEGAVRFLVGMEMMAAKELLQIAIRLYPHDLRLYKMLALPYLHDRTIDWQSIRLHEFLYMLEHVKEADSEIFAIKAGVCKALWRLEKENVLLAERAIEYYLQSFKMSENDLQASSLGFGACRAAMLTAELHLNELRAGHVSRAHEYKHNCRKYLHQLIEYLHAWKERHPGIVTDRYYSYNEAFSHFGLAQYEQAARACIEFSVFLSKEKSQDGLAEYYVSTDLRQLTSIILFSGAPMPASGQRVSDWHPAWRTLYETFRIREVTINREVLASFTRGQVGMALSGGGLRAVFVHLGLLARLAECDMLRSVESISVVSAGSIVGVLYYMLVKDLLERKPDEAISKEDYVEIVRFLIERFQDGCSRDIWSRTLYNPLENFRISFGDSTTRTHLLSQQLLKAFYQWRAVLSPQEAAQGEWKKMSDLMINPVDWKRDYAFHPRLHNWRRANKVPALYINCTTLNTGHLWRFTPAYMGETVDMAGDLSFDNNSVLENVRYQDCRLPALRDFTIADAVTVSACVPGWFDPFTLKGLYENIDVQLLDGGVFDNYGLQSLYHAQSDFIICSDASLHLEDDRQPSSAPVPVLSRCLDIQMDLSCERISRELQVRRKRNGVSDICIVHLRLEQEFLFSHSKVTADSAQHQWKLVPPITILGRRRYGRNGRESDHDRARMLAQLRMHQLERQRILAKARHRLEDQALQANEQKHQRNRSSSQTAGGGTEQLRKTASDSDIMGSNKSKKRSTLEAVAKTVVGSLAPFPDESESEEKAELDLAKASLKQALDTAQQRSQPPSPKGAGSSSMSKHHESELVSGVTSATPVTATGASTSPAAITPHPTDGHRTSTTRATVSESDKDKVKPKSKTLTIDTSKNTHAEVAARGMIDGHTPMEASRLGWEDDTQRGISGHRERAKLNTDIRETVAVFRSSLDRLTEVEMSVLMTTGYTLATAGLKLSQAGVGYEEEGDNDHLGGEGIDLNLKRSVSTSRHRYRAAVQKLSPTEKEMMFPKHWGYFDVDSAPLGNWPFSPVQKMLSHPAVERKNAGIEELREQLKYSAYPFGVQRWWNSNWFTTVLLGLVAMAAFVYGCYVMISDFIENGGVDQFGCRCYTQSAIFYVALFFVAVIMLAKPGYLGRFVWAGIMVPAFGGVHVFLIDPWLAYKGSQRRILGLFNSSVSPEERIYSYAPHYIVKGGRRMFTPFDGPTSSDLARGAPHMERELSVLRDQDGGSLPINRPAPSHSESGTSMGLAPLEPLSASVVTTVSTDSLSTHDAMARLRDSQRHSDD